MHSQQPGPHDHDHQRFVDEFVNSLAPVETLDDDRPEDVEPGQPRR
ncbi:hypothetical protein DEU32_10961 [Curtobacterium sp. AG1037]|nr:hypothetical protein [Curtobacterium sp. AG1037]RDH96449.1 hypothetical protein DEU32_10961 [Curtobacterium sp. AG1037]